MDNNEINQLNDADIESVAGGASGYIFYTVVRGDTLGKIASRFRTTIQRIMDLNPIINDPDFIKAGWTLKIPN